MKGDTVLMLSFREPVTLLPMLTALPFVAEATEEPFADGEEMLPWQRRAQTTTLPHIQTSRFRLVLKAG